MDLSGWRGFNNVRHAFMLAWQDCLSSITHESERYTGVQDIHPPPRTCDVLLINPLACLCAGALACQHLYRRTLSQRGLRGPRNHGRSHGQTTWATRGQHRHGLTSCTAGHLVSRRSHKPYAKPHRLKVGGRLCARFHWGVFGFRLYTGIA